MKTQHQHLHGNRIPILKGVLALWTRRIRVNLVLAGWALPDRLARMVSKYRSCLPIGRTIAAVLVLVAIVTPSALYIKERSGHLATARAYRYLNIKSGVEISTLKQSLRSLASEQESLRSLLLETGHTVISDDQFSISLVATGYSSTVWQTDDTPFITASNTRTRTGVVALSRDLLTRYNPQAPFSFGDTINISGFGDFIVEDSMHWRWRRRLDIWFPSTEDARRFGKRNVTVSMPLPAPRDTYVANESFSTSGAATGYPASSVLPR